MTAYERVVVGTDGSPLAVPTVKKAARIASRDDAGLTIVCAYTDVPRRDDAKNTATLGGDTKFSQVPGWEAARLAVDSAAELAREEGARIEGAQLIDADAATALLHVVKGRHADLLVIGAIRDTSIAGRLLGTVATEVFRSADCDVLIVRPTSDDEIGAPPESINVTVEPTE